MNRRTVDMISMKTLLRFKNLWYLVDLAVQVPRDIMEDPLTIGILSPYFTILKEIVRRLALHKQVEKPKY